MKNLQRKFAKLIAGTIAIVAMAYSISAMAHHSFAMEFSEEKPVNLTGKLVKWRMINPHSVFVIEVETESGEAEIWEITGGSPNQLIRLGVTRNTLQKGMVLNVRGYQARSGARRAAGRDFTFPDGTRLFIGAQGTPE